MEQEQEQEQAQQEPLLNNVGRPSRLHGWKPKKWRPEYERMVAMSCLGWSNKMIAAKCGYTPEHVSMILNLDQAEEFRMQILQRMRNEAVKTIPEQLEEIAEKVLKRTKQLVDSDEVFDKSPFAVIDRGFKVLEGLGYLGKQAANGGVNVAGNAVILQSGQVDALTEALTKSNQVREIHAPQQIAG